MKVISLSVLLLTLSISLNAQPLRSITYQMMVDKAEELMGKADYKNALEFYQQAYEEKKEPEMALKVADVHYLLKDYNKAARQYRSVLRRDKKDVYLEYRLFYAKCLKRTDQLQDAYNEFIEYAKKTTDPDGRQEAMLEIKGLEMFNDLAENTDIKFVPLPKEINKAFSLYGARLHPDGNLYFGSFDSDKEIVLDGESENGDAKIFVSTKDDKGKFATQTALGENINRKGYSSLHPAFSEDGNRMYFTRLIMNNNSIEEAKIYVSVKTGSEWGAAKILPNVNGDGIICRQPAVGELYGREVLFFIADMPGGYGGEDIYYATIDGDSYGKPINLGEVINTKDDEISPFYFEGTLYYSTNGLPGLGGFDVYSADWNGNYWEQPINLGKGYNSLTDDLFYSLDKSGEAGFIFSNRPYEGKKKLMSETCCDHIFEFGYRDLNIDLLVKVLGPKGSLLDAKVELVDLADVNPEPAVTKTNFNGNTFTFPLDKNRPYKAIVSKTGFDTQTIEFTTAGIIDDYTVEKTVTLVTAVPEMQTVKINEPIRLNNIYYDYNDFKILPNAEKDLEVLLGLMEKYSDMVIELSSHTDARGTDSYNLSLSQKRANSAKEWLVQNGVKAPRIKAVGYGETVILNKCVNGVECTDEEHRFNRRTEFKIISGPTTIEIEKQVIKGNGK